MTNLRIKGDMNTLLANIDAAQSVPVKSRRTLSASNRGRLGNAVRRGIDTPIVLRDENGRRTVSGRETPAHIRRYFAETTFARKARQRPHRADGRVKGGPRPTTSPTAQFPPSTFGG